jgi:hypothetical protein
MPYDPAIIDREIQQAGKRFAFLRAAVSRYADLYPLVIRTDQDPIYVSWLAHEDTTDIELIADDEGVVRLYAYLELDNDLGRVYSGKVQDAWLWLHSIQHNAGPMHKALVLSSRGSWDELRAVLGDKNHVKIV